jgi:hypothetical protein
MIKRTGYLKRAAEHPSDTRLYPLREFIGTLDGIKVFCMIRDTDSGPWRVDWSRDSSHLWHIHKSFWTKYCADQVAAESVFSVLNGVTWEQWNEGEDDSMYVLIESSDTEFNNSMWVTDGNSRRKIRNPGEIRNGVVKTYGRRVTLTDSDRAGRAWPDYLSGVMGDEFAERTANLEAALNEILAAALDDGDVNVTLPPETIAKLQSMFDEVKAETRDAVADLGEGGSVQVRADE